MLCRATSESWRGHPPKKLPAPLASTTSRSNVCKDGSASLRAPSYACKTAGIQTLGRVQIWAGHSMSAVPTRAHLGHAPARVRRALAARWAGRPVSDAPSWHRACGCSVGCRFGTSFRPGWASGPGAAIHTDAAPHPGRTAGPAGPSSAGGELGTGGAFCGRCQLPLFALFSSSPLVAEQRALWLCTTGNVIKPHAPGASSRGAGGGPGHLLEAGGICCRHCGASAPAGGVWVAVGISLGLQVRSPHPPVC